MPFSMHMKKKDKTASKKIAPKGSPVVKNQSGRASPSVSVVNEPPREVANCDKRLYCQVFPLLQPTTSLVPGISNIVPINYDSQPVIINNEHFTGYAAFRCNNFDGHMPIDPATGKPMERFSSTDYFNGHRRTFSLQISGRFRKEWSADDVMFGTFFEKPIRLPPGYQIAIKIAKKIDASMDGDLGCDTPYMCSPLICAMNVMRADPVIQKPENGTINSDQVAFSHDAERGDPKKPLYLPPWQYGGARHLEENFMATVASWPEASLYTHVPNEELTEEQQEENSAKMKRRGSLSSFFFRTQPLDSAGNKTVTPAQRRSWFLDPQHRKSYKFHPDTLYSFDFNNQYVDLNRFELKLGLSFDVSQYLNGQPVRYQMRSRDGKVIFFTIELGRV